MAKAKVDFLWFEEGKEVPDKLVEENPNLLPFITDYKESKKKETDFDLNNDGKVDKEDLKLAAKTLRKVGSKLKRKRKTKK